MSTRIRTTTMTLGLALAVGACGTPTAPPAKSSTSMPSVAAKPATPAATTSDGTPATPAATTPKSLIEAAKSAVTPAAPVGATVMAPSTASTIAEATASANAALNPSVPKYDPAGRRDPFESLEARVGSNRSTVSTARLTGVIHSGMTAFALVETSDGIGYILKAGDTLADGRLLEIGASAAVFSVAPKPGMANNRVVLRLASD